jgi:hypothetical protein
MSDFNSAIVTQLLDTAEWAVDYGHPQAGELLEGLRREYLKEMNLRQASLLALLEIQYNMAQADYWLWWVSDPLGLQGHWSEIVAQREMTSHVEEPKPQTDLEDEFPPIRRGPKYKSWRIDNAKPRRGGRYWRNLANRR